jgi:predicted nucleic acid-binding protein
MSADRATYLDSSAIVKLVVAEPQSDALRRFLRRRRPLVSSALARTEVARALAPGGVAVVQRGEDVLRAIDLVRVSDSILRSAGHVVPIEVRSLDAIHLATARALGQQLSRLVTYDDRVAEAARANRMRVEAPA